MDNLSQDIEQIVHKLRWNDYDTEAMENLPEHIRKFVEGSSWAAEIHAKEVERIATSALTQLFNKGLEGELEATWSVARAAFNTKNDPLPKIAEHIDARIAQLKEAQQ